MLEYEKLEEAYKNMEECKRCSYLGKFLPGYGNPQSKLVFVGLAPSWDSKGTKVFGSPETIPLDRLLKDMLDSIHIDRNKIFVTNLIKRALPENREPTTEELQEGHQHTVYEELEILRPKLVVLMGAQVSKIFGIRFGETAGITISNVLGHTYNFRIYSIFHPAAIMRGKVPRFQYMNQFRDLQSIIIKENAYDFEKV